MYWQYKKRIEAMVYTVEQIKDKIVPIAKQYDLVREWMLVKG